MNFETCQSVTRGFTGAPEGFEEDGIQVVSKCYWEIYGCLKCVPKELRFSAFLWTSLGFMCLHGRIRRLKEVSEGLWGL